MPLTPEELLKPRVKLIAPIPFFTNKVYEILYSNEQGIFLEPAFDEHSSFCLIWEDVSNYPHLFQFLPWYAERKESEMPEYVKSIFNSQLVAKVIEWNINKEFCRIEGGCVRYLPSLLPATFTEYEQTKPMETWQNQ